jgi:adenosylhomocysteine nucleosidase
VSDGDPIVAITFALPAESSDFVRRLSQRAVDKRAGTESINGTIHGKPVAVFHTGVGEKSCRQQIGDFLRRQQFKYLISTGFAGALDDELQIGDLLLSENFSSPELLRSPHFDFVDEQLVVGKLATVPGIVDSRFERDRWAAKSGAVAVDMETEFIAAACAAHQIPMLSLRAISDTPSKPLPAPPSMLFDLDKQKTDFGRLALHLVTHPGALIRLNAFRHRIAVVRQALTAALDKLLRVDLLPL